MAIWKRAAVLQQRQDTRPDGFGYLPTEQHYLDTACQSMRPQPVIDALTEYFTTSNACGGRVKYAWGRAVDGGVVAARSHLLKMLHLAPGKHTVAFTLNTTYGLGLLLQQLGDVERIVTTHVEHNSVFLSTIAASKRLGVPRVLLERDEDGAVRYGDADLRGALVVLQAASNFDGSRLRNVGELIADTHRAGGIVILDAAQAIAHHPEVLERSDADAIVFSAHKLYGPSLGVIVAKNELIDRIDPVFVGGGMVSDVLEDSYTLTPGDRSSRLEPGLQAWGEILAFDAALGWLESVRVDGVGPRSRLAALAARLDEGLSEIPGLVRVGHTGGGVASVYHPDVDAHRLAQFASSANVMLRSGYFCAHHELLHRRGLPPLLRFSLGLHNTDDDVDAGVEVIRRLVGGLA